MTKRILFLTLHRPNRSPSQRFRFEQYLGFLKEADFDYHFSYLLSASDDKAFYKKGNVLFKFWILIKSLFKRIVELFRANRYDIIFVQRECFMLGTSFFERSFARSKAKLIFDFDDSIWLQNVSDANKSFKWLKNPQKTAEIVKAAHQVIAGNEYLANYAKQYNQQVTIIPTTIDTEEYKPNQSVSEDKTVCIGWSGSITTIQHFKYAEGFLKKIKSKYGGKVSIKVIGDGAYVNDELSVRGIPWTKENELSDISSFDIGIMPLPDDEWAKGKCGLKGLQYMALKVPTIMSPVGVNKDIIEDGKNGFLANTEEEWFECLSKLIDSPELRVNVGEQGRKTVEQKYSNYANKDLFLQTLQRAIVAD